MLNLLALSYAVPAVRMPGLSSNYWMKAVFRLFSRHWLWSVALLMLMLTGCTTRQKTQFHIAVANMDSPNPDLKFYRVTIKAKASNVKTDFQTGFYDANAVRQLYGNVSTNVAAPQDGHSIGSHQFVYDTTTKQWVGVPDSELYTIVYGADAKAIAATIRTYNESDQNGQQMASLIAAAAGHDGYMQAIGAEQLQKDERLKLSSLLTQIQTLSSQASSLTSAAAPADVGGIVVQAIQDAAQQLGSTASFDPKDISGSLQKAQQLLDVLKSSDTGK